MYGIYLLKLNFSKYKYIEKIKSKNLIFFQIDYIYFKRAITTLSCHFVKGTIIRKCLVLIRFFLFC